MTLNTFDSRPSDETNPNESYVGTELSPRGIVADPSFRHILGAIAATATIMLGLPAAAATVDNSLGHPTEVNREYQKSRIVGGVWSLVMSHSPTEGCTMTSTIPRLVSSCEGNPHRPRLLVEQCYLDIKNAKNALHTVHFTDRTTEVESGCYDDWVAVSIDQWSQYADGNKVQFAGQPSYHLTK